MSFLFLSAPWLEVRENHGYGPLPIPNGRDEQISTLLRSWMNLSLPERLTELEGLSDKQTSVLLAYSERMASYAVRRKDSEAVLLGLIALGLEGEKKDWRENLLILSLHFDAASKIAVSPSKLFKEAGKFLPTNAANALDSFLRRKPADQSINAMGYKESADEDGFRYQRTW